MSDVQHIEEVTLRIWGEHNSGRRELGWIEVRDGQFFDCNKGMESYFPEISIYREAA